MDADILRLILFVAGVALILGIYFWDRHKKINERVHAIRRAQQSGEPAQSEPNELVKGVASESMKTEPSISIDALSEPVAGKADSIAGQEPATEVEPVHGDFEQDLKDLGALLKDERADSQFREAEQVEFSFSAEPELEDESLIDLPELILQINLKVRKTPLSWQQVVDAATEVGLEYGDMQIYHRREPEAGDRISFSMANMVNPGTFPATDDGQFSCPGLTLFSQLPGPKDGLAIFSDMLFTAERLASLLDAQLQDEHHSDLSKQTIEHIRAGILEHRRQLQLARKRA